MRNRTGKGEEPNDKPHGEKKSMHVFLKTGHRLDRSERLEAGLRFEFLSAERINVDASPVRPTEAIRIRRRSSTPYGPLTI